MATSDETRFIIKNKRRHDRQLILLAKRQISFDLLEASTTGQSDQSIDNFTDLIASFCKLNKTKCYEALIRLNSVFFDDSKSRGRWINAFFNGDERTIHYLVGLFTNQHLDNCRIQTQAGACLANLCCTDDVKQQNILIRLATPYFVSYLADGDETTRLSLALSSLRGLGNLASGLKNKRSIGALLSQHALESIASMIGHGDHEIQDAAFFALESLLETLRSTMAYDEFGNVIKRLSLHEPTFGRKICQILNRLVKTELNDQWMAVTRCSRCLFLFSTFVDFPIPNSDELRLILDAIERLSCGQWQLQPIFFCWRSIGTFINRTNANMFAMDIQSELTIFHLVDRFLRSLYVPLRKETLWVFSSYLHTDLLNSCGSSERDSLISSIISAISDVGKLTICKDTLRLCLEIFYALVIKNIIDDFLIDKKAEILLSMKSFLITVSKDLLSDDMHIILNFLTYRICI